MRIGRGLVLGLLLTLSVAGCGGGNGDDGVATAGGPGTKATSSAAGADGSSEQDRALKFGQCMRDNGVANFPDPEFSDGGGMSIDVPEGTDPQKVDAAMQKCKQYLPNGGEPAKVDPERAEQNRKLAKCMRDNGVTSFPDPGADGGIQINGNDPGMNMDDPKFQAAQKACAQYQPSGGAPGSNQTGGNG
ncbi:hypothetical protein [Micromonospora sp. NPDC050200]|uniref:hypothetical protein n=1 Tax=Micromonospora sp. NPDC050200 TaxID=3155664 RepID=UPI0033E68938